MVPGMTERERLAADVRRLEWLADATLGPAGRMRAPTPANEPALPLGIWRGGLTAALLLGQRIHWRQEIGEPRLRQAPSPIQSPIQLTADPQSSNG